MTERDKRKEWAQFRFGVIAPLVCRRLDDGELRRLKKEILSQTFCPHGEFYWDEQLPSLIDCFRKALLKRGKPRGLLADNAFIYHSKAMRLACSQLGIESKFCAAYDPPGKGKIEKSYGTAKNSFYKEAGGAGLRTLDELNKFWFAWLTREYHHAEHSALNQMTPIQRWKQDEDGGFIQRVSTEDIRRALMLRETRRAHIRTGTIRLNNRCYQLSPEFAGRQVDVLYEANKRCDVVEIWQDGKMVELAKEVVPGANIDFTRKRQKKREDSHGIIASSRDYRLALVAAHQNESPLVDLKSEYVAEPEFQALVARLLSRQFTDEEQAYLSRFFFENAPMTGQRTEQLLAQVVNAKGTNLHLRSYCSHIKQGLNQQRS